VRKEKEKRERRSRNIMSELIDFVIVSMVLVAVGIYGLVVKRNAIRMLFSIEIIVNAANLLLVAFSRGLPNAQGQVVALFSIAIAAAEVAVGLGLIIVAYRLYKEIDVAELRSMRGEEQIKKWQSHISCWQQPLYRFCWRPLLSGSAERPAPSRRLGFPLEL
jgi:NADH:ubiquinone oxidoreductase subunit K